MQNFSQIGKVPWPRLFNIVSKSEIMSLNLSNVKFLSKKTKHNALFMKTVEHHNYNVKNETSNVLQHGFNNFTQQLKK